MSKIARITIWLLLGIIAIMVILSLFPISGLPRILTVESGSMEPAISRGSLVFVLTDNKYELNDIVTYISLDANLSEVLITHRVIRIENTDNSDIYYHTKGDANNVEDLDAVNFDMIVGKVIFFIPILGFLVSFAKTKLGVILLIVIPCLVLAYGEIKNIGKEVKDIKLKKRITIFLIILLSSLISIPITYSLFSDKVEVKGNIITIGTFDEDDEDHCGVRTGNPHEDKCRKPHPVPDRPGNPFLTDNNTLKTQEILETDNAPV
jgi:signal peptidase